MMNRYVVRIDLNDAVSRGIEIVTGAEVFWDDWDGMTKGYLISHENTTAVVCYHKGPCTESTGCELEESGRMDCLSDIKLHDLKTDYQQCLLTTDVIAMLEEFSALPDGIQQAIAGLSKGLQP